MGQIPSKEFTITRRFNHELRCKTLICEYKWKIDKFVSVSKEVGKSITSEKMKIDCKGLCKNNSSTEEWEIVLYPHGFNDRVANYLSIWIRRMSSIERLVQFTCSILNISENREPVKKTIKKNLTIESTLGWSSFCKRDILNEMGILKNDQLTLNCTLEIFEDICMPHPTLEDEDPHLDATYAELSNNLKESLSDKKQHDVTFKIDDEIFTAHKAILSARSSVFRAMFKFEKLREVVITDIEKKAFRAMLLFLYSGECQMLPAETAFDLYYAADKYELSSLRRICSKIIESNFSIENAVKVIILADRHEDRYLKDASIRFITKHAVEIQKRDDWLNLLKCSPDLANTVFERLAIDSLSKVYKKMVMTKQ